MKKFRAATIFLSINEYEIISESEKKVKYVDELGYECSEKKISNFHSWHNTKEEAKSYLTSLEQKKIEQHQKHIEYATKEIEKIKTL